MKVGLDQSILIVRKIKEIGFQLYGVGSQEGTFTATMHKTHLKLFKVSLWNFEIIRGSLMMLKWQKLASLAQEICTL